MARYKFLKSIAVCSLLAGVIASGFSPMITNAEEYGKEVTMESSKRDTKNGIVSLGTGKASIVINGNNNNQLLIGKKFNVYKLFNAENSKGGESINYTVNKEYEPALKNVIGKRINKNPSSVTEYEIIDYIQSLNNNKVEGVNHAQVNEGRYSDFRYFVEELRNEIFRLGSKADTINITDVRKDNSVQITGLEFGYYLVDEISAVQDTHSASSLCMVNTANPNVAIKIKSDFPTVIKKIQEDDNKTAIGDNGWNDIGDYEIGQKIPYKFESNVPNMNGYHTYYYSWHDKMDKALTFNKDSVGIKISDESGKSYTLQNKEFNVIENPGNGETFKIEIRDIKAIVDREFNKKNSLGENVYGQKVILTYNATLNDKASNDTGRPGFENDVKLEFSNNPDSDGNGSTGETPWDTVVCFTYKINGLKINEHDVKLENAKFRLYSDKECKNEVYVKKGDDGYIVINRDSATNGVPAGAVEMVSNSKGEFNIIGLDQGTYWLKETGAPDGYRPLLDPIEIQIVPTFSNDRNSYVKGDGATDKTLQRLDATAKVNDFWGGIFNEQDFVLDTDINDGSINLSVVNRVGTKLPATGSSGTLVLLGIGSVLAGGSILFKNKIVKNKVAK